MTRTRIGILGTAKIAEGFARGASGSPLVEIVAVASRTIDRATAFAAAHGVPRAHASYEALLADEDVDVVYVPLPNALHVPWAIAAARAKKHVLCEKPLAPSEREARAIFDAADENGVLVLEAFPYHFQPQTLEVCRLIESGAIGDVLTLQATFGFPLSDGPNVRLDAALAGGALMDVGCYPVSFARLVFGARPSRVSALARWSAAGPSGVDLTLAATLDYARGGIAQIACSMATAVFRRAGVVGTRGVLETDYLNHTDRVADPCVRVKRGVDAALPFESVPVAQGNGFRLEAEAFAEMIARGDRAANTARRRASVDNAATLAAILESARSGASVAVAPSSDI